VTGFSWGVIGRLKLVDLEFLTELCLRLYLGAILERLSIAK
jgi:hypothetical protein